jgi:hypothetical protein
MGVTAIELIVLAGIVAEEVSVTNGVVTVEYVAIIV